MAQKSERRGGTQSKLGEEHRQTGERQRPQGQTSGNESADEARRSGSDAQRSRPESSRLHEEQDAGSCTPAPTEAGQQSGRRARLGEQHGTGDDEL
jgi:hypothetical protein